VSPRVSALDPVERRIFYIGTLTQSLGLVEAYLDLACEAAFQELVGRDKFKELPQSMKGKLRLLRFVYTNSDKLEPMRGPALELLDHIDKVSEFRNMTVHAVAIKQVQETGTALLRRVKHRPNDMTRRYEIVSLRDILHAIYESGALQMAAPVLAFHVFVACGEASPADAPEPFAVYPASRLPATKREAQVIKAIRKMLPGS
jgi:hypothetical protein